MDENQALATHDLALRMAIILDQTITGLRAIAYIYDDPVAAETALPNIKIRLSS